MFVRARMPLLDRLVDTDPRSPAEPRPARTLDREGLRDSVRRELERLLNTRSSLPADRLESRELTVIDYGIPDLSAFSAGDPDDQRRLAAIVARTVAAFEPRLRDVKVAAGSFLAADRSLPLTLEATLVAESWSEPVSFPILLGVQDGRASFADE
jgi:type VI secretion system protein ImpF